MHIIKGDNLNQIVYRSIEKIKQEGFRTPSRNGDVTAIYDVEMILSNPKSRHLNLDGRTNNIFATLAEVIWVMAGEEKINPYLSFFIPRAPLYSDDNTTWRAAYGERLYAHGQLQNIIDVFKEEGIFTRRAVLSLLMPDRDTKQSLKEKYGLDGTKDTPCNNWFNFFVTPDKKLNLKVTQRSGDIIFGTGNINFPEFTFLQEFVLQILQEEVDSELTLGYYHHSVTNLHLYDFNGFKQSKEILSREQVLTRQNYDGISFPKNIEKSKEMFSRIVKSVSSYIGINMTQNDFMTMLSHINSIFDYYSVEIENNTFYAYVKSICYFVYQENGCEEKLLLDLGGHCDELKKSIQNNHFNKIIEVV